jgi:hypothetical protein
MKGFRLSAVTLGFKGRKVKFNVNSVCEYEFSCWLTENTPSVTKIGRLMLLSEVIAAYFESYEAGKIHLVWKMGRCLMFQVV